MPKTRPEAELELEIARTLAAFYMNEESRSCKTHPLEKEYAKLVKIPTIKRTKQHNDRLKVVSQKLHKAIVESDILFHKILNEK